MNNHMVETEEFAKTYLLINIVQVTLEKPLVVLN